MSKAVLADLLLFAVCGSASIPSLAVAEHVAARKPVRGLRPGANLRLVAPARGVSKATIQRVQQRLEQAGFRVTYGSDLDRQRGYLAGTDEQRAAELMAAFTDPQVDAIVPMSGGYGCTRILDRLDWDVIRQHPKLVFGFSDITALHLAIAAKTDFISVHASNADGSWGKHAPMAAYTQTWFWRITRPSPWPSEGITYDLPPQHGPLKSLSPGVARGALIGGNLTLVSSLMGTPYEVDTRGKVLFIEDVHEAPYRVDRYLSQLRLAGKLKSPAAVILGQFTDADPDSDAPGLSMEQVFHDYFGNASYPVLANFPAGHHRHNAALPMGADVEVNADQGSVRLLHAAVR